MLNKLIAACAKLIVLSTLVLGAIYALTLAFPPGQAACAGAFKVSASEVIQWQVVVGKVVLLPQPKHSVELGDTNDG